MFISSPYGVIQGQPAHTNAVCVLTLCENAQFVGLLTCAFSFRSEQLPPSRESPNDLLWQKGETLCAYSTALGGAVFRCCTGFPCSAEQECVSVSRVAHLPQNKPEWMEPSKRRWCFFRDVFAGRGNGFQTILPVSFWRPVAPAFALSASSFPLFAGGRLFSVFLSLPELW